MHYSVFGASGFIGSSFVRYIRSKGGVCREIPKDYDFSRGENLGHVIYAIGLTADFRQRPMDTVRAHVSKLVEAVERLTFDSFLYLSSTRVYGKSANTAEDGDLIVNPNDFSDLYNISKLMGESVCLAVKNEHVRIVRLSNVLGDDFRSENFVLSLIKDAVDKNKIMLQSSSRSEKDYIDIEDVLVMMEQVSCYGAKRLYNLASGLNIPNSEIVEAIQGLTNCAVDMDEHRPLNKFAPISTDRLASEFSFVPGHPLRRIQDLILNYKKSYDIKN